MPSIESELEDVAKLRHMANEFAEGFNTGDVERIMRFYGDSYVDINLRNPVQSRQERREYYAQVIRKGGFKGAT
jgi:ketosteroid isomerase-like protein